MDKKSVNIPSLDFDKLEEKDLCEFLKTNRKTNEVVEDIKIDLDVIKSFVTNDKERDAQISKELQEISKKISSLIQAESPRMLSKCDAIVGNTQSLIVNINKVNNKLDEVIEDIDKKHCTILNLLISMSRDISLLQCSIEEIIQKRKDFLSL